MNSFAPIPSAPRHHACLTLFVAMLLLLAGAAPASAQEAEGDPLRSGFWFSGGLGYGSVAVDGVSGREDGLSGNLSLGGTVSPRFLIGGGTTGWTKEELGLRITFSSLMATSRFYPSADGDFYLAFGLGFGQVSLSEGSTSISESGGAAQLGLGFDARVGERWSITPFVNFIGYAIENLDADVFQLGVGLTYH